MALTESIEENSIGARLLQYKLPILLGLGSLVCIVFSIILLIKSVQTSKPIEFVQGVSTIGLSQLSVLIDIGGAVGQPGVYRLPFGSRIIDAIASAGGIRKEADVEFVEKSLNRARVVEDGMKIYIPYDPDMSSHNVDYATNQNDSSHNLAPVVATSRSPSQNGLGSSTSGLISINSASQSELESLPSIGPVTAKKIIDNRPYGSTDELLSRKVVGKSTFEKIRDLISL